MFRTAKVNQRLSEISNPLTLHSSQGSLGKVLLLFDQQCKH